MSIDAPPPVKALRRYLVAGLLLWVPLGITFLVLRFLVRLMDQTLLLIPVHYRPDELLGIHIPGLGILLAFIVLLITGMLAANLLGRRLLAVWEGILDRIPFVRTIYGGAKNFAETVLSGQGKAFNKVLLVEYPKEGIWSLAFKTSEYLGEVQAKTGKDVVCVFVPTTPNPTSGFIIMVPRDEVIELDMEVDQALKMIISLGVVVPRWKHPEQAQGLASKLPGN
ncbi:MAG: DUF502 domain-containing protein [Gammaproteobacteria bacterium]|nr:DUF502 domain-containing protein [Gammaproteobacteria bacterium]